MSRKKSPIEIAFNRNRRSNEFARRRDLKELKDVDPALEIVNEFHDIVDKVLVLDHMMYTVKDRKNQFTESAMALPANYRKLLVRRLKVMGQYASVLGDLVDMFKAGK